MTIATENLIQARNLHCTRHLDQEGVSRVFGVDLSVNKRRLTLLRGPAGSGKNLLLRLLSLQDTPDTGEVWYRGRATGPLSEFERAQLCSQRFGFLFATPFLLPTLSVMENIATPLFKISDVDAMEARERVEDLLNFVGMPGYAETMSEDLTLAEQKRVALARALVNHPEILFGEEVDADVCGPDLEEYVALLEHAVLQIGVTVVLTATRPLPTVLPDREIEMAAGRVISDTEGSGGKNP